MGNCGSSRTAGIDPEFWNAPLATDGGDDADTAIHGVVTSQPETYVVTSSMVENDPRYGDRWNEGYQNFYVARVDAGARSIEPHLFGQRHDYSVSLVDATTGAVTATLGTSANIDVASARGRKGKTVVDPWTRTNVCGRLGAAHAGQEPTVYDGARCWRRWVLDHRTGALSRILGEEKRAAVYDIHLPKQPNPRTANGVVTKRQRGLAPRVVARVEQLAFDVCDIPRPVNHSFYPPIKVTVAANTDAHLLLAVAIARFRLYKCDKYRWTPDAGECVQGGFSPKPT